MWTVIYIAQTQNKAERLAGVLSDNRIISRIRRSRDAKEERGCFEVLVPGAEIESAQNLIFDDRLF